MNTSFSTSDISISDIQSTMKEDLICFSHLRWDFVYQRPQHLMSRCAADRRVFFVEEPIIDHQKPFLDVSIHTAETDRQTYLWVVVPHIPAGLSTEQRQSVLHILINELLLEYDIENYLLWYYTPEALSYTRTLKPQAIIYDCMDDLSLFKDNSPELCKLEAELFSRADIVFTNGQSLYQAKCQQHNNIHCFPSSIDMQHFQQARYVLPEPQDQREIPYPRLGFFGVLDERLDLELLGNLATLRPEWHIVLIGPILKIDREQLPKNNNIHYLGMKVYQSLPNYLASWNVALMPLALNDSTRYISPSKTSEYLAGGKPVVSTPIPDVVQFYGEKQFVRIAGNVDEFIEAIEQALSEGTSHKIQSDRDAFLTGMSWDKTWNNMAALLHPTSQQEETYGFLLNPMHV